MEFKTLIIIQLIRIHNNKIIALGYIFIISGLMLFSNSVSCQTEIQTSSELPKLDMSTSLLSLTQLCKAISDNDINLLKKLTTEEGFEAIISDRGLASLQIDILFWMDAMENGRIFVSEKIESEKEYILLQKVDQYEILCVMSGSEQKSMLVEKLTFIKENGKWKFLLFSEWEKD